MGDRLTTKKLRGFGVLDPAYVVSALDTTETTATEAGPRPGTSSTSDTLARLVPQVLGAQTKPIAFLGTVAGGFPGLGENGGAVSYYLPDDGETDADARHWRAPWIMTDARGFGSSIRSEYADAATFPSGRVLVFFPRGTGGGDPTYLYNPHTASWTENPAAPTDSGAIAVVPGTERVLLVDGAAGVTWFSDDYGDSWSILARFKSWDWYHIGTGGTVRTRLAWDGSGNLAAVATVTGTSAGAADGHYFHASSDLGCTWSNLTTPPTVVTDYDEIDISSHPSGSIAVAYVLSSDTYAYLEMVGSAYDFPLAGNAVEVRAAATTGIAVSVDDDGIVYVWRLSGDVEGYYSLDAGASIESSTVATIPKVFSLYSAGTEFPRDARVVHSAGRAIYVHGGNAAGNLYRGAVFLGGWAGPTFDRTTNGDFGGATVWARELYARLSGSDGPVWYGAVDDPAGVTTPGWVASGTGTFSLGAFGLRLNDTSARRWTKAYTVAGTANDDAFGYFSVRVDDEGDGATTFFRLQTANHDFRIYVDAASWYVYDADAAATIGATVAYTAGARLHFEVYVDDSTGDVSVLWREAGTGTAWSTVTRTLTGSSSRSFAIGVWGAEASVSAYDCTWFYAGYMSAFDAADYDTAPVLLSGADGWGKAVGSEYPYPIPDTSDPLTSTLSRFVLRGGPVARAQTYTHDVAPDFPVEAALFPDVSPSPDTVWRSTSDGVVTDLVVDLGADTLIGDSWTWIALARNVNFRLLNVAVKPDGGAYPAGATMDLATGFSSGLTYTLAGRHVRPTDTYAGTDGARYVAPGELRGGHVILDADGSGGGPFYRRITGNTGGFWGSGTPRLSITLADVDGTEDTSGDIVIVWPSGYMPLHLSRSSSGLARRVRFRIPASESTAEGYLEAGTIAILGFRPLGKQWANGYELVYSTNTASRVDAYGTDRRRQRGPNAREGIVSWDHGVALSRLRGVADADYLGASGAAELVARDEVWRQVWDLYDRTDGGARPVLLVHDVPASGVTVTDPDAFLFGHLDGSARVTHVSGDDVVDEFVRVGALRVREAV